MYTVTLIAQKGGTGKTTLAINFAVAAEALGLRTALVDLDPQASAAGWGDHRESHRPAVATVAAARLRSALHSARDHGAGLAVIDTARTRKRPRWRQRGPPISPSSPYAPECSTCLR